MWIETLAEVTIYDLEAAAVTIGARWELEPLGRELPIKGVLSLRTSGVAAVLHYSVGFRRQGQNLLFTQYNPTGARPHPTLALTIQAKSVSYTQCV